MSLIFDIVLIAIAVLMILVCAKRGFLKSLVRFARLLLALTAAYFLGSVLANFLAEQWIAQPVQDAVYQKVNGIYENATEDFDVDAVIESMPQFLMTDAVREELEASEETGAALVSSVSDSIASALTSLISNILGYVGVFLIALLVLWLLVLVVDKLAEKIKLLKLTNTLLGAVWGAIWAFMLLFMISSIIRVFCAGTPAYDDSVVVRFFGESALLEAMKLLDVGGAWFSELLGISAS